VKIDAVDSTASNRYALLAVLEQSPKGNTMKGMNQKKDAKKKPEKTLKEKRAEKDAKKATKR
jgi:hypothetical protein